MRTLHARRVLAAGAAALMVSMFGATATSVAAPVDPPQTIDVTLQFSGVAADMTQAGAETKAKEEAAKRQKEFTDATKATCTDKSTVVTSTEIADDQFLAHATTTTECQVPVPAEG